MQCFIDYVNKFQKLSNKIFVPSIKKFPWANIISVYFIYYKLENIVMECYNNRKVFTLSQ